MRSFTTARNVSNAFGCSSVLVRSRVAHAAVHTGTTQLVNIRNVISRALAGDRFPPYAVATRKAEVNALLIWLLRCTILISTLYI